ncbi:hypothetical protein ARMGADRAFT_1035391 [Armillaria gallica]|uniref:Uncharacterized protein n=1 Tax=Armillaria gallica TaxID=47427 RepID=A0A2H3CXF3_ARMGA|nr:hypothetical protein ARMGADRAFT_1035391 [Armillaria gallica]
MSASCISPCQCQEFFSNVTQLHGPSHLQHLVCDACQHPWYSHLVPDIPATDPLYAHRHTGLPAQKCQGFYPLVRAVILSSQWNPRTICVCNGEWMLHGSYHANAPSAPVESNTTVSQPAVGPIAATAAPTPPSQAQAAFASRISGLPPPVAAIRSLASVEPEEANRLRMEAAQRTLPHNQPSASNSQGKGKGRVKAKAKAKASSTNPTPNRLDCDIIICPNIISPNIWPNEGDPAHAPDDSFGYQQLTLRVDHATTAFDKVFIPNFLSIHATFQPRDLLLTQVYNELRHAAHLGNYTVPGLDEFHVNREEIDYAGEFPWVFLSCKREGSHYRFSPDPDLGPGPEGFNAASIIRMGHSFVPLHRNRGNRFFLVVAPRFDNILGPVEQLLAPDHDVIEPDEDHACFAYRILFEAGAGFYRRLAIRGNNAAPAWPSTVSCLDSCPKHAEEPHAVENVVEDVTPDGIMRMTPSPDSMGWSPPPVEIALRTQHRRVYDRLPNYGPDYHRIIEDWQRKTYKEVTHRSSYEGFWVSGTSVALVAKVVWDWLLYTVDNPPGSFPRNQFSWNRQFQVGEAIRPGPEWNSWQATLGQMVTDSRYWRQHGDGTYTFVLSGSRSEDDERQRYTTASGRLIALSLLHLGQGFISLPWVVLALIGGSNAFAALNLSDIRTISESETATVLFADALSADISEFAQPRSPLVHSGLTARLNARMLLDDDVFWEHPDLITLRQGFNWWLSWDPTDGKTYLELYVPFVDINDVIQKLRFEGDLKEGDELPSEMYQRSVVLLFRKRLKGYLRGTGHPASTCGELVTVDVFEQEKDNPLVRRRLLLDATWALPCPLAQPHWSITFMYKFKNCDEPNWFVCWLVPVTRTTILRITSSMGSACIRLNSTRRNSLENVPTLWRGDVIALVPRTWQECGDQSVPATRPNTRREKKKVLESALRQSGLKPAEGDRESDQYPPQIFAGPPSFVPIPPMPPKPKKRPANANVGPSSPKNKKKSKSAAPPLSPPPVMRRSTRTVQPTPMPDARRSYADALRREEPGNTEIGGLASGSIVDVPEAPPIVAPRQCLSILQTLAWLPRLTDHPLSLVHGWEVTEETSTDDLCMIVLASLDASRDNPSRSPSLMMVEPDPPEQADSVEDNVVEDLPLFFTGSSHSPLPVNVGSAEPLEDVFLYIGLYIRHNKRMVLGDVFRPSQKRLQYRDILQRVLAPRGVLQPLMEYAWTTHLDVQYHVGTSYKMVGPSQNFMEGLTWMPLGPVKPPTEGLLTQLQPLPTPASVYEEWGPDTPPITYVMYIYPELLSLSLLNLPSTQAGIIDSIVLVTRDPEDDPMPAPDMVPEEAQTPAFTLSSEPLVPDDWLQGLLQQQIGSVRDQYNLRIESKGYGTAYTALLQDGLLVQAENMMFAAGRQAGTFDYEGKKCGVSVSDVQVVLLGAQSTWKNHRSLIRKARRAHQVLRLAHARAPTSVNVEDASWLELLNTFFTTNPLAPSSTYADSSSAEF